MGKFKQEKLPRVCISKALLRYKENRTNGGNTYKNHLVREFSVCHRNGKIDMQPNDGTLVEFGCHIHDDVDCIVHVDTLQFTPQEYKQIMHKLRNAVSKRFDFVHEQLALSTGCIYLKKKIPTAKVATKIIMENMHRYEMEYEKLEQDDELLRLPPDFEMLLREQTPDFSGLFGNVEEQVKM